MTKVTKGKRKKQRDITMECVNTPATFAQRYLSTYFSFDYRPNEPQLIFNTKTDWYYVVSVTAFIKTRNQREIIGHLIIKDPNGSNKFKVVFEVFERGFNVRYPKMKGNSGN